MVTRVVAEVNSEVVKEPLLGQVDMQGAWCLQTTILQGDYTSTSFLSLSTGKACPVVRSIQFPLPVSEALQDML